MDADNVKIDFCDGEATSCRSYAIQWHVIIVGLCLGINM